MGRREIIKKGNNLTIIAIEKMIKKSCDISCILKHNSIDAEIINAIFLNPLDIDTINNSFNKTKRIVTIENNDDLFVLGSNIKKYFPMDKILLIDYHYEFLKHGSINELEKFYKLDNNSITEKIKTFLKNSS